MDCAQALFDVGELVVGAMLASEIDPPAREWDRALEQLKRYMQQHQVSAQRLRLLVITQGGSPNTRQRAELKVAFDGHHPRVGVISAALDSPLRRGIATAIQWINPHVALFAPEQAQRALAHLELAHATHTVLDQYRALERSVRPLPVLQLVEQALKSPYDPTAVK